MDNKKFIEIINEYCEWYYPKIPDNGSTQWTNNSRISAPNREELGPQIVKYKPTKATVCDWCNQHRPVKRLHQRIWIRGEYQGWRHRCLTCNKHWDGKTKALKNGCGRRID